MMLHNNNNNSPDPDDEDDLISSLQRHGSATSTWKIRTNELALAHHQRAIATASAAAARKLFQSSDQDGELGRKEEVPVCLNALSYSSASSSSSSSSAPTSPLPQHFKQQNVPTITPPPLLHERSEQADIINDDHRIQIIAKRGFVPLPCLPIAIIATASLIIIFLVFSLCCLGFTPYAVHHQPPPFLLVPT